MKNLVKGLELKRYPVKGEIMTNNQSKAIKELQSQISCHNRSVAQTDFPGNAIILNIADAKNLQAEIEADKKRIAELEAALEKIIDISVYADVQEVAYEALKEREE